MSLPLLPTVGTPAVWHRHISPHHTTSTLERFQVAHCGKRCLPSLNLKSAITGATNFHTVFGHLTRSRNRKHVACMLLDDVLMGGRNKTLPSSIVVLISLSSFSCCWHTSRVAPPNYAAPRNKHAFKALIGNKRLSRESQDRHCDSNNFPYDSLPAKPKQGGNQAESPPPTLPTPRCRGLLS